jgi:predicted nucleic acid-binding protein
MHFVLDAAIALSFVLDDERDDTAGFMLSTLRRGRMIVPVIWRYEVANGLLNARRRKRLDDAGVQTALGLLDRLDVEIDAEPPSMAAAVAVGREHRLSAYDALYVMLAHRAGVVLVTRDDDMIRAAKALRVHVL